LRRDPECPVCGENPTITELIDYEQFCGIAPAQSTEAIPTISVHELKRKIEANGALTVLDVREPFEYEIAHISGSKLIPLGELPRRFDELARDGEIAVHCKSGKRSAQAVQLLRHAGFTNVANVTGGIDAWANEIDPSVPKY
jgi:adenylyltransferase/sulfurtransferase